MNFLSFHKSKLVNVGIYFLILWVFASLVFLGCLFLEPNLLINIIQKSYDINLQVLLVSVFSLLIAAIAFQVGVLLLTIFFTKKSQDSPSSIKGKFLFLKKFGWISFIFPFYCLRQLFIHIKTVNNNKKILPIITSLFIMSIFVPIWVVNYFSTIAGAGYLVSSILGYAPVLEQISGTGSMYPTFPKGNGKTDKENAKQIVVTVTFRRYPGGIELFGKRYFNHVLERGDIVAFQNKMTEEFTQKQ